MKLRRGCKESERVIRSKQCGHFYRKSFRKVRVSNIPCDREIRKDPDQSPDGKELRIRVSVSIRDNPRGLTAKCQGEWSSREKFRVKEGSFLSPAPYSSFPSLPSFRPSSLLPSFLLALLL